MTQEEIRLSESGARRKHWKRWGPYLSERASGIVRISLRTWLACAPRAWATEGCCPSPMLTSFEAFSKFMLDEHEFLSPYVIRALSQFHRDNPYRLTAQGMEHRVDYEPGESSTGLFGGNSNWRGPIWFPVNYLLVESLQKFHHYFGKDFKVEFPTGSGKMMTLWEVAGELSRRMTNIFLQDQNGRRPVFGNLEKFQIDPHWRDLVLFHEYFHGDSGAGVGASHQTGWTGVVTKLMQQSGGSRARSRQRTKAGARARLCRRRLNS